VAQASGGAVLVRLPNWLGDALMARPLLAALRRAASRVVAVGPAALLDLLAGDRTWDEALPWPLPANGLARLRAFGLERAFVLPPSFSSAWLAWRSGAKQRIGYAGDGRSALLTRALRRPPRGERHLAREYLALLDPAVAEHEVLPQAPALVVGSDASRAAQALRRDVLAKRFRASPDRRPGPQRPLAILGPGAAYGPAKRWPVERFAALAVELHGRGFDVLACGGRDDASTCDAVADAAGLHGASAAGLTRLSVQAALCADAAVVISNDSGLAHLAAATGAPTVALFGSTSSAWTAPLGSRVRVVQRPPVCSPCFQRTCAIGYVCQERIAVADVFDAIEELGVALPAPAAAR
jgi:heptosyltransferase-2